MLELFWWKRHLLIRSTKLMIKSIDVQTVARGPPSVILRPAKYFWTLYFYIYSENEHLMENWYHKLIWQFTIGDECFESPGQNLCTLGSASILQIASI